VDSPRAAANKRPRCEQLSEALDVRLAIIEGEALSATGQHAAAVACLLPIERVCGEAAKRRKLSISGEAGGGAIGSPAPSPLADGSPAAEAAADRRGRRPGTEMQPAAKRPRLGQDGEVADEADGEAGVASTSLVVRAGGTATPSARPEPVALEELLGAERRVHLALKLARSLLGVGRPDLGCAVLAQLLDDMRHCSRKGNTTTFYDGCPVSQQLELRVACIHAAHTCARWPVAYAQVRLLNLYLPCTFPVPSLYLPCTFPVPSLYLPRRCGCSTCRSPAGPWDGPSSTWSPAARGRGATTSAGCCGC
jgi:hypothetical protein